MKYRKPLPVISTVERPRKFFDTRRLSPGMAVLFYSVLGLLVGTALFGGSFFLWDRVAARRLADVRDAPTQYGVATVELKRGSVNRLSLNHIRALIGFRINGHLALMDTDDETRYGNIHLGDRVAVQYRVGKTGDIYIDDWQGPLHSN